MLCSYKQFSVAVRYFFVNVIPFLKHKQIQFYCCLSDIPLCCYVSFVHLRTIMCAMRFDELGFIRLQF